MEEETARHITFGAEAKAAGMAAYQEGRLTEHQEPDGPIGDANKFIEPTANYYANASEMSRANSGSSRGMARPTWRGLNWPAEARAGGIPLGVVSPPFIPGFRGTRSNAHGPRSHRPPAARTAHDGRWVLSGNLPVAAAAHGPRTAERVWRRAERLDGDLLPAHARHLLRASIA